ncbi:MoaD/ThiS family protein [Chloroflexota bacterium]
MTEKTISVNFLGIQRRVTGEDAINIEMPDKMRVIDVIELVKNRYPGLDLDKGAVITTVNQEKASADRVLKAGDIISFLPYISGG